jgi:hypothetical protein
MGYVEGSYWDKNDVICGFCGYRIKDPPPTGYQTFYKKKKGILGWIGLNEVSHQEPTWPKHIGGRRGEVHPPGGTAFLKSG